MATRIHWILPLWLAANLPLATVGSVRADDLSSIVAEYETLAEQTDANDGPGWPDVSVAASERRTQAYASLRARLAALPPVTADSEAYLTARLLDWRLSSSPRSGAI